MAEGVYFQRQETREIPSINVRIEKHRDRSPKFSYRRGLADKRSERFRCTTTFVRQRNEENQQIKDSAQRGIQVRSSEE